MKYKILLMFTFISGFTCLVNAQNYKVGDSAPNFTQTDQDGNNHSLTDYGGRYVLVDFWASWCGPCMQETPYLAITYKLYHPKGFEFISISLDRNKEQWINSINTHQMNQPGWVHLSDLNYWNNSIAVLYGIQSIPSNLLIDPSGKILAVDIRGVNLVKAATLIFGKVDFNEEELKKFFQN